MKKGNNFELRDGVSDAFLPFWEMCIVKRLKRAFHGGCLTYTGEIQFVKEN